MENLITCHAEFRSVWQGRKCPRNGTWHSKLRASKCSKFHLVKNLFVSLLHSYLNDLKKMLQWNLDLSIWHWQTWEQKHNRNKKKYPKHNTENHRPENVAHLNTNAFITCI